MVFLVIHETEYVKLCKNIAADSHMNNTNLDIFYVGQTEFQMSISARWKETLPLIFFF